AVHLSRSLRLGAYRAAIVAATPSELEARLAACAIARPVSPPRIGFLFPGQGSPSYLDGGAWCDFAPDLYRNASWTPDADGRSTAIAQPAIVTAALAGLRALDRVGIEACVAIGHSLGELVALHWAGAIEEAVLLRIAAARGRAMAETPRHGAMAAVAAGSAQVRGLLNGSGAVIAGLNSPRQTVISGDV